MLLFLTISCIVLALCVIALAATGRILYYRNIDANNRAMVEIAKMWSRLEATRADMVTQRAIMELNIPELREEISLLADFKVITKINQLSADLYGVPVGDCVPTVPKAPQAANEQDEPGPLPRIKPVLHGGV